MKQAFTFSLCILVILPASLYSVRCTAQDKWRYTLQANFGCAVLLHRGPSIQFPGLKLYGAFIASARRGDLLLIYSPSLSIYTKSIGANLNPLINDWQMDLTQSFQGGMEWGASNNYLKFSRSIQNGDYYNITSMRAGMALIGTNFILNNHGRHQTVGSLYANVGKVSASYFNDGPPFSGIGLSDGRDRYWTSGVSVYLHNEKGYNTIEFGFNQFTGYVPLLYELTGKLGMRIPLYDQQNRKDVKRRPPNFNTASYTLRVGLDQRFAVQAGVIGSLKFMKRYYGLQELIHNLGKYPLHPNDDVNRFFIGGSYNQTPYVRH